MFSSSLQIPDVRGEVWSLVRQIPRGCVSTYGTIAVALGDVGASRLVGEIMVQHDHVENCICHRVVRADGSLGKHVSGSLEEKQRLLQVDGVAVTKGFVDLAQCKFEHFECNQPLQRLQEYQEDVAQSVCVTRSVEQLPDVVGGLDVSFVPNSNLGVVAYVEVDLTSGELQYVRTSVDEIRFPYISGYLAYRELPLIQSVIEQVRKERSLADVIVVDGSGVLHPRRAGVATMAGVTLDICTIGLTKKRLLGSVDTSNLRAGEAREILVEENLTGYAMLPGSGTEKPIYCSPGHNIDVETALAITRRCLLGRRLPEPIYWADRESRAKAKTLIQ